MALQIDTHRALRRPLEIASLVDAVIAAGLADESSWIEWKSTLDLTKSEGAFTVAKAILAFANRMPDQARTTCQGLAYFVLGAGPGSAAGTAEIDAADLENYLIKYLGSDGPSWSPTYVTVDGATVLVIVIEAPQWGDPIHTLRATLGTKVGATKGTIFVRSQAQSRPAEPGDITQLSKRLIQGLGQPGITGLSVDFEIHKKVPGLLTIAPTQRQVENFLDRRKRAIYDRQDDRFPAVGPRRAAFDEAVEEHLSACHQALPSALQRLMIENRFGLVSFVVINPGDIVLENVELTLTLDVPHVAYEEADPPGHLAALPEPPKPPAPPPRASWLDTPRIKIPSLYEAAATQLLEIPDQRIEIEPTSISLDIGRLRPRKPERSTRFFLFLLDPEPPTGLRLGWTLNSTSTVGIQDGEVLIPVLRPDDRDLTATLDLPRPSDNADE